MDTSLFQANDAHVYKLYKRRFVGLVGMVRHSPRNIALRPSKTDGGLIFD
jgi:hypothetical protein